MKYLLILFLLIGEAKGQEKTAKVNDLDTTWFGGGGSIRIDSSWGAYMITKVDTVSFIPKPIPCILLVSNKNKPMGAWTIRGYIVGSTFLGKNKKPVPGYIQVWDYKLLNR